MLCFFVTYLQITHYCTKRSVAFPLCIPFCHCFFFCSILVPILDASVISWNWKLFLIVTLHRDWQLTFVSVHLIILCEWTGSLFGNYSYIFFHTWDNCKSGLPVYLYPLPYDCQVHLLRWVQWVTVSRSALLGRRKLWWWSLWIWS